MPQVARMPQILSPFKLSKWYVDVLDQNGGGLVGYKASMKWRGIQLGYEGLIPVGASSFPAAGNFQRTRPPTENGYVVQWESPKCTGTWTGHSPPISKLLLESKDGSITWHCLQPKSSVEASVGNQQFRGMGYAEKIDMTIPPWRMPIKTLYWGRYVSERHSIVWIRWVGVEPRLLVIFNGVEQSDASVDENLIEFEDCRLMLPRKTFRKGNLGKLFSGLANVTAMFPSSMLSVHEEKWAGLAELKCSEKVDRGNVIHEKVVWP